MQHDLRGEPGYAAVLEYFREHVEPALGRLGDASEAHCSADGRTLAVAGTLYESVAGLPAQRLGVLDLTRATIPASGTDLRVLESSGDDLLPRWAPVAPILAFVSDRAQRGKFGLYLLHDGEEQPRRHASELDQSIENIAWSPDGAALLLQTVGLGADRAGALGSGAAATGDATLPAWLPHVETAVPDNLWRRLWLYRLASETLQQLSPEGVTFWEAAWCGDDAVVAVVSDGPREGEWHHARLVHLELGSSALTTLYRPAYEIGLPAATTDGSFAAVVEACCSDRTVVAGDVLLFDLAGDRAPQKIPTGEVDVTHLTTRDADRLVFTGVQGLETVVGEIACSTGTARETYRTAESFGYRHPNVFPAGGDACTAVVHAYARPPAVVRIDAGRETILVDLAHAGCVSVRSGGGAIEDVTWQGRDGLTIQGLLVRPGGPGPHPLVVIVHGGPVGAFTNAWQMSHKLTPLLARNGYAVLHPNPRGSSGRGQPFARMVRGDMNGEDTYDIIAGVDALVAQGIADGKKLAITGVSYGGMMASWMVTQTTMFAAAIAVAPVTDAFSQHLTSNIPVFDRLFLASDPYDPNGKHVTRSAVRYARNVKTPTLSIAGANDRCTPPTQALEFHRALVEHGVPSELVVYPLESHGVRQFEAFVDYCARILAWFERYVVSEEPRRTDANGATAQDAARTQPAAVS